MISDSKKRLLMSEVQLDHNRLLSLINNMSEAFIATNEVGEVEVNNGVALDILDTNALNGKLLKDAMPVVDTSGVAQDLIRLSNGTRFNSRDLSLRYKDGRVVNLFINVSAVRAGFGSKARGGYVVIFRDITREKSAEEERDDFISVAGHELRNPIAIAEGSLSNAIFLGEQAQIQGNLIQVLKTAHDQLIFLGHLINDLSTLSRADRERLVSSADEFDAVEILKSIQQDYEGQAAQKGLKLDLKTENLPKLYGSRLYTREILQNFVTNSIKYTQKGHIIITGVNSGNGVDLSVMDSGIGIDETEHPKVFSKFFRSQDSRVRSISGTGLGLYVSAKLAKLIGGDVKMSSELNKGSTFVLHLPRSIAQG